MKRGLEAVAMEQVGPENNLRPNGRDDDGADTSGDKPRSRGIRLAAETDLSGFFEWSWMTLEGPNNENVMSTSEFVASLAKQPVVVVGIFGKSSSIRGQLRCRMTSKEALFDNVLQRDVFWIRAGQSQGQATFIQGFHEKSSGRIYLMMKDIFDPLSLLDETRKARHDLKHKDFSCFLSSHLYDSTMMLLFLFHVCHVMILYHPSHRLDVSYISLFKTVESMRLKLQNIISDKLRCMFKSELPKEWISQGRQIPPRMLFYFAKGPVALRGSRSFEEVAKREGKPAKHSPIKRLELAMEDQVNQIYRKARIVTNSTNNLFSLPSRGGFAFIDSGDQNTSSAIEVETGFLFDLLDNPGYNPDGAVSYNPGLPFFLQQKKSESRGHHHCFSSFLEMHLQAVAKKGLGSESKISIELPRAKLWFRVAEMLLNLLCNSKGQGVSIDLGDSGRKAAAILTSYVNTDNRFSETRCSKALHIALQTYKEGLLPHYREEYHNAKLLQAMSLFSMSARGPACSKYAQMLAEECGNFWKNGRQMCEEISLTGNPCNNRKHYVIGQQSQEQKVSEDESDAEKRMLPTIAHNSGVMFLSSCNCGKRQVNREDPFTTLEANYEFYAEVEDECCHDLEHIDFPFFHPSKNSFRTTAVLRGISTETEQEGEDFVVKAMEELDITDDSIVGDGGESKETLEALANLAGTTGGDDQMSSSMKTIEHMLTTDTPGDKLPLFPSWSLVQLGSSYLYSHSSGLNQPGFLTGSKMLLSWEIPLQTVTWALIRDKWPNLAEFAMKKPNFKPKPEEPVDMTVKAFIGFEYECLRGHRFLSASPGKQMKSSPSGLREAASKMVASDIPLYINCSCRSQRASVAQLMRIHIVTPKAPIHITLLPLVQPDPLGPIFHTGWSEPVKLQHNSYWVLRLPFIYYGSRGVHVAPKPTTTDLSVGRFLKGSVGVTESFEEKVNN